MRRDATTTPILTAWSGGGTNRSPFSYQSRSISAPFSDLSTLNPLLLVGERVRLDQLAALPEDWDRRGSAAARSLSIRMAQDWLPLLFKIVDTTPRFWVTPHIGLSEDGEVVFEWWGRHKKLTLYFEDDRVEAIRIWGPNIEKEMQTVELRAPLDFRDAWIWLCKP